MSSITKSPPSGVINDLPSFWSSMASTTQPKLQLPSDRARLVTQMTEMEVATLRCFVPELADVPPGHSTLSRAAAFLAVWNERGILRYMSGHYLARAVSGALFSLNPFRSARRGLEVLADLDGADLGVEVYCSTLRPDPPGLDRYARIRLSDRLDELSA